MFAVRTHLLFPGLEMVDADTYNQVFTLHGVVMFLLSHGGGGGGRDRRATSSCR